MQNFNDYLWNYFIITHFYLLLFSNYILAFNYTFFLILLKFRRIVTNICKYVSVLFVIYLAVHI